VQCVSLLAREEVTVTPFHFVSVMAKNVVDDALIDSSGRHVAGKRVAEDMPTSKD
jgi:hypothetical protein